MDKIFFVGSWFGAVWVTVLFAAIFLIYLSSAKLFQINSHSFKLYSSLPRETTETSSSIIFADARAKIIEDFFTFYGSELGQYSGFFIEISDQYKLDWKLLPAIAMQESNGGKKVIKDSFNPFGFGIYGSQVIKFSSWEEGIEKVGRSLREDYLDQGLTTPEEIMVKYTPPSLLKGGAWAKGVRSFMTELR